MIAAQENHRGMGIDPLHRASIPRAMGGRAHQKGDGRLLIRGIGRRHCAACLLRNLRGVNVAAPWRWIKGAATVIIHHRPFSGNQRTRR